MGDAGSRSGGEPNYVRDSLADSTKSAAGRDAFLHASVLGNYWRLACSRNRAKVLARAAHMDAAHVADFYSRHLVTRCLGRDNGGLALASTAVFSRTRSGVTQSDQRSWAFTR